MEWEWEWEWEGSAVVVFVHATCVHMYTPHLFSSIHSDTTCITTLGEVIVNGEESRAPGRYSCILS